MTRTRLTGQVLELLNFLIIAAAFVAAFLALSALVCAVVFVWSLL